MPRVDGTYTAPYPDVVPDTTIESEVHNGTVADLVFDANYPRPVIAGGTGASNAAGARSNLQAEAAAQVVTNYDSHNWENGSFKSAAGATGAPNNTQSFSGICHRFDATSCFIEARAYEGNQERYFRRKYSGTWYPWTSMLTSAGDINVAKDSPFLNLIKPLGSANSMGVQSWAGTLDSAAARWTLHMGLNLETGSNAGSDFAIARANDAGAAIETALSISRQTGTVTTNQQLVSNNDLRTSRSNAASPAPTTGTLYFGNLATDKYLHFDGTDYNLVGGTLNITYVSGYGTRITTPVRSWGVGIIGGPTPGLTVDDITGNHAVGVFTEWNGTYATLVLPSMTTTAVAPNCAVSTSTGTFIFSSSRRYKTDIQPLQDTDADKLMLLDAVSYKSTSPVDDKDRRWYGFIAEDVDKIDPLLVHRDYPREDRNGGKLRNGAQKIPEGVDYTRITVLAVHKVQAQERRIKEQEQRIAELLTRLEALERKRE